MVRFIISRTRQKKFYYTVESPDLTTLLTSNFYASKIGCQKGIIALKNAIQGLGRYQWVEQESAVSFIIKSAKGQRLATSKPYDCVPEASDVLSMLKKEIPGALVDDQTVKVRKQETVVIS
ncbi:hypothetical protein QEG73_18960 [Chitinophagaceae bacterium 26-R-25]|nr:hypothetical protein [Chitinophagaceae bacterium 26-R-25]